MKRRTWAVWLGMLLCLGVCVGCKRPEPTPATLPMRVVDIQIASQTDGSAAQQKAPTELDRDMLLAAAIEGLRSADVAVALAPAEREPGDFVLQIELGLVYSAGTESKPKPPLLRALTAGLLRTRRGGDAMGDDKTPQPELTRLQHLAVAEQSGKTTSPTGLVWSDLARRAVRDTSHSLGAQLRLCGVKTSELTKLANDNSKEPDLRGVALRLLAMRKDQGAQKLVMAVLKDRQSPSALRDQAIGALVELGDPKSVRPLLDSTEFRDRSELGKVLEAAAALGGDEAQRYLEFVAQSHSDAQIRDEAKTALGHLLSAKARQESAKAAAKDNVGGPTREAGTPD
ncbi:MAG TPA: HEAT repeat domain-containing protein [Pseudomonadota bacterium]|nr:HEAT repeat domain-containing protein [Pseudomonadota bacterium]HNF97323.1 HEAT repeat domain-containing protein [Pseudomonadota bacterium]HNI61617.1 HEAT repeat domain-containing protein [Pseudomonadota bacterium]HNN53539.1 HEAT repeat domain-containing protein [Pseudomonadota bacterium]HNO67837.1 HEAT repeat domain-containing protein [Pseudomonadota bacterium]